MFDRFAICEAYLALEIDYEVSGWLQERGTRDNGSAKQVTSQLWRMGYRPSPLFDSGALEDEAQAIYDAFVERHNLPV